MNLPLSDYGFSPKNAKSDEPAILALILPGNFAKKSLKILIIL